MKPNDNTVRTPLGWAPGRILVLNFFRVAGSREVWWELPQRWILCQHSMLESIGMHHTSQHLIVFDHNHEWSVVPCFEHVLRPVSPLFDLSETIGSLSSFSALRCVLDHCAEIRRSACVALVNRSESVRRSTSYHQRLPSDHDNSHGSERDYADFVEGCRSRKIVANVEHRIGRASADWS